jgi:hypothetical protein
LHYGVPYLLITCEKPGFVALIKQIMFDTSYVSNQTYNNYNNLIIQEICFFLFNIICR